VQALPGRAVLIGDVATVASPVVVGQSNSASGPPIAFFFPYGVAVLWGFTEVKRERYRIECDIDIFCYFSIRFYFSVLRLLVKTSCCCLLRIICV
jgi:hypothetical protein